MSVPCPLGVQLLPALPYRGEKSWRPPLGDENWVLGYGGGSACVDEGRYWRSSFGTARTLPQVASWRRATVATRRRLGSQGRPTALTLRARRGLAEPGGGSGADFAEFGFLRTWGHAEEGGALAWTGGGHGTTFAATARPERLAASTDTSCVRRHTPR